MSTTDLSLNEIFELATACLSAAGANSENARAVARTVMTAERDGSVSHGLFRLPGYVASLKSGKVNGAADPRPEFSTEVVLRCHGQNGFAPLAHARCLGPLGEAARKNGLAVLAITHTHHFAALWPEVETLAEQGLCALTCVSYKPSVAPAGGTKAFFGTNPIGFAWPRENDSPMVVDMATAAMAQGEISVAARDGHSVPPGTGLDASGQPTTDPAKILEGVILPFGGYKGSALSMMVELLAGPLVGEAFSYETAQRDNNDGGPAQGGQFVLAMSPELIAGQNSSAQCEAFFSQLLAIDGVRLPGERRHKNRTDNGPRAVNTALVEQLRALVEN
ncbi:MAG: Ldh family oxidoreductase [Burkholderiaceae bacterium]